MSTNLTSLNHLDHLDQVDPTDNAEAIATSYTPPKYPTRCKGCHRPINWAEQRRQWGRLLRKGYAPEQAKDARPRCQKCMTAWMREHAPEGTTQPGDDGTEGRN